MDTSFDEFFEGFDGAAETDDGYQTDSTEGTTEAEGQEVTNEEENEESTQEGEEGAESGETSGEVTDGEAEKAAAEGSSEPDSKDSEQTFTIKVNKEERTLSLAEMTEYAQKGADYDRVKGQLEESRKSEQEARKQLGEQQEYIDVLNLISEQTKTPVEKLIERLHVETLKGQGMSEKEALAEIRAAKAERQVKAMTEQPPKTAPVEEKNSTSDRAQKELSEFRDTFPDVNLTKELVDKLMPDVQKGMSLLNAYQKQENARIAAELAEQQRKEAAEAQNRKNRAKATGSQKDSGTQSRKTAEDDFFAAFEK